VLGVKQIIFDMWIMHVDVHHHHYESTVEATNSVVIPLFSTKYVFTCLCSLSRESVAANPSQDRMSPTQA
jgi:hypothetical protein